MTAPKKGPIYLSRTFWVGVGQMVASLGMFLTGAISEGLTQFMAGLGIITARQMGSAKLGVMAKVAVPVLLSACFLVGCAAVRSALGLPEDGSGDAPAVQAGGDAAIAIGGLLPGPVGMVVQIAGNAISAVGAAWAHMKQKTLKA